MKSIFALSIFFLTSVFFPAQESVLFGNDRFSGISSAPFSPTQPYLNENLWDVNLFSTDVFVWNDYAYISQESALGIIRKDIQAADIKNGITGASMPDVMDYFNKDVGNYHFSSDIMGPAFSASFNIKQKKYTAGFFSRLRTQGSVEDFDNYWRYENQGLTPPDVYFLKPFETNFMNWGELGIHISTEIFPNSQHRWIVGANLKYELGFDAVNAVSDHTTTLTRVEWANSTVHTWASDYNIALSYATAYDFEKSRYSVKPQGKGLGLDFGFAFVNCDKCAEEYYYKLSFNILDVGYVNFTGKNHLLNGAPFDFDQSGKPKFNTIEEIFGFVSEQTYGNPNASLVGTDFTIGLPTSLHFNFSKNIGEHKYLNFNLVQRTPIFENSLKRNNIANVSYSFQKNAFGYGASTSLYEYKDLQFGGYFRLGPLVMGSENIIPIIFKHKRFYAADFYIALKINAFWDGDLKRRQRDGCQCD
ncbi:MAG: hypothetical protein LBE36_03105 [Flavobacteriaceae bacterium]|nr:hypothetical protein [Flavobacteriaceae bacterium]